MMHAYSEIYLDDAMKNLGEAFDYAVNSCHFDADRFIELLIVTGLADAFGSGNPRFISGLSGTELVMETIDRAGFSFDFPVPQTEYDFSPEYWCGWILAYYQWTSGMSFKELHKKLSMKEIHKLYGTMHEASEERFADAADVLIRAKVYATRLQIQRKICEYSQSELARKSGVNIRTLQQYETRAKDINKASAGTVRSLARVLGCRMEDILEAG